MNTPTSPIPPPKSSSRAGLPPETVQTSHDNNNNSSDDQMKAVCGKDKKYVPEDVLEAQESFRKDKKDRDESPLAETVAIDSSSSSASSSLADKADEEEEEEDNIVANKNSPTRTTLLSFRKDPPGENGAAASSVPVPPPVPPPALLSGGVVAPETSSSGRNSPKQRLRRATVVIDPISESTSVQRLVEYFVVISSCKPVRSGGNNNNSNSTITPKAGNGAADTVRQQQRVNFRDSVKTPSAGSTNGNFRDVQETPDTANSKGSTTSGKPKSGRKFGKSLRPSSHQKLPSNLSSSGDDFFLPKITARYPLKDHRDNPLNPMVLQFCFPTGDEIVPSKTYQLPRIHYFVLTNEKGRKVYGTCLTVMEDYHPPAGDKWTQQADVQDGGGSSQRSNSKDEDDDAIEVRDDKPLATLYIPKVLCLLSSWPYLTAFREYLAQLYRLATATNVMTAPIERYIVNLCGEIPAPPPGAYEIQVPILDSTIRFWAPPAKLPIAYVALPYHILFECLDVEHILDIFCALIVEHKIVLISSQYSILTICSEILCSLLFPMRWSHLYIPVLPVMLSQMLDAPVPFICGVVRENWIVAQEHVAADAIIVDLDNNKVTIGRETPSIPAPPQRKWNKLLVTLQQSLGDLFERSHGHEIDHTHHGRRSVRQSIAKMREVKDGPQWAEKLESWDHAFNLAYTPDSELMDAFSERAGYGTDGQTQWDKVQEAFLRFFVAILKDYRRFLSIPSPSHGISSRPSFDVVGYLDSQPQSYGPFLHAMCMTQQFDDFITRRMYSPGEPELVFFDQSIDAKLNRSRLKLKKVETPFVQNAKAHKDLKKIKAIEPNEEGLTDFNFDRMLNPYIYKTWPDTFDETLFTRPRPAPKMIAAEFDRQALLVSQLRIDAAEFEEDEYEFFGGDYDTSPEVGAFTVFFFAYCALVGVEWQQYKEKALIELGVPSSDDSNDLTKGVAGEGTEAYKEEVEAVMKEEGTTETQQTCINDQCVTDLTLGCCNNADGLKGVQNTLVYVNKGAEEVYSSIFQQAADQMSEIQRTLTQQGETDDPEQKGEARAQYEEAREVAAAQLDLAFETLKTSTLRGLPADLDAYKSLMEACGRCGETQRALNLIEHMKKDGFVLDGELLSCFVQAFAHEEAADDMESVDVSALETSLDLPPHPSEAHLPTQDAYSASIRKGLVALQEKEEKDDDRPWLNFGHRRQQSNCSETDTHEDASQASFMSGDTNGSSIVFDLMGGRDVRNRKEVAKRRRRRRRLKISKDKKVTPMLATQLELGQTLLEFLYPDLQIDTNKQSCPHCSYTLPEDEVIAHWTPCSFEDFTTRCTKCAHRFVPHFSVTCSDPAFKGSQGPGSALFCEFLSPWVVRKALHHVIKGDVGIEGMLDPTWRNGTDIRATLFWNLIVMCRRYNLPFTFLLQGSVEGRIILPRMPSEMA